MQEARELSSYAHGADKEVFHPVPAPMEIAIDPERPFLPNSAGLSVEKQQELLAEYEESFHDEDPDSNVEGVRAGLLPVAIIAEADAMCVKETGRPLVPTQVIRGEDEDGNPTLENAPQFVMAANRIGESHIAQFGRFVNNAPSRDGQGRPVVKAQYIGAPQPNVHTLRAVILPVPAK